MSWHKGDRRGVYDCFCFPIIIEDSVRGESSSEVAEVQEEKLVGC